MINIHWLKVIVVYIFSISTAVAASYNFESKPASPATIEAQTKFIETLPEDDGRDADFVNRGFIGSLDDAAIKSAKSDDIVFDASIFDWMEGDTAPDTVNPSLWRHTKLLRKHGLFKVTDGVWQVRSLDTANMTIIRGKTGWIILDCMTSAETASAAMSLVKKHLGDRPVTGVMYSHSHPDHMSGVRAILEPGATVPIIAPEHIIEETVAEYIVAGNTMGRRADYQVGMSLKPGPRGYIGSGLFTSVSTGEITIIRPTDHIKQTGETRVIDGITFEYQMVPETEAPSEMNVYLPEQKILYVAEMTSSTMHNLQTPRGALVRDALNWAGYLTEALSQYGEQSDILLNGHGWPRFGNEAVREHLRLQRDSYKYIHDQTVRMMNNGATPLEIAEVLQRPPGIANEWSNRGYYGTVRHNSKGVFQRYIGWWDGIPAHLNRHTPAAQGKRYVQAMGGTENVLKIAAKAMGEGDYRWSAEILNHVIFTHPENDQTRALLADTYEQMGYQQESAVWRNYYLTGAYELRSGVKFSRFLESQDLANAMQTESLLVIMGTRLNPAKIGNQKLTLALEITDTKEQVLITVNNAVLVGEMHKTTDSPDISLRGNRRLIAGLFLNNMPLEKMEKAGLAVGGDRNKLHKLWSAIEMPSTDFPIVTP